MHAAAPLVAVLVLVSSIPLVLPSSSSGLGLAQGAEPSVGGAPSGSASGPVPWPTYMDNIERTGANDLERSISPSNVAELRPLWMHTDNGSDFSAPIVVNGVLYFGSWTGWEYALDPSNGAIEWQTFLGTDNNCVCYPKERQCFTPMGISSTPEYVNGTLYLGGGDGYWYALNATTGATEWRYLVGADTNGFYDWSSALVYQGSLYVGISSCLDSPLVPAGLLELGLDGAGSRLFRTSPPNSTGESIWTTPAVDPQGNTLWITTGNENPPGYPPYANALIGLNATTLLPLGVWQVPNVAGLDSDFGSTPTLFQTASGTPMVVATDKNGIAYALDRSNVSNSGSWRPTWTLNTGGGFSGGAFAGGTLFLAGGSSVYALDPADGAVLWRARMTNFGNITGSLAWANGLVYAAGGREVEAIDAANGTVLWNYTLPTESVTEPVIADGQLYVACGNYGNRGYLIAFGLPPSAPAAANTSVPAGFPVWTWVGVGATLVVAGGAIALLIRRRLSST